ncbi:hypothetical protein GCM10018954_100290 [Kutzneria kofuensis]
MSIEDWTKMIDEIDSAEAKRRRELSSAVNRGGSARPGSLEAAGKRRVLQPGAEEPVQRLERVLLGDGDELVRGHRRVPVLLGPSRSTAKNASSPSRTRKACRVRAPRW